MWSGSRQLDFRGEGLTHGWWYGIYNKFSIELRGKCVCYYYQTSKQTKTIFPRNILVCPSSNVSTLLQHCGWTLLNLEKINHFLTPWGYRKLRDWLPCRKPNARLQRRIMTLYATFLPRKPHSGVEPRLELSLRTLKGFSCE